MNGSIFRSLAAVLLLASGFPVAGLRGETLPAATPESQGLRSDRLREMGEFVRSEQLDVRSLLVVRNGHLVLEWYADGVTRDHNHNIYSITKSVVATLAGIAIAEGKISGTNARLVDLLPDSKATGIPAALAAITLEDLLTMRSGLPVSRGNRSSGPERELFDRMHREKDRTRFVLAELEPERRPGARFAYSNVDPRLVLAAVEQSSGESTLDFAESALFGPLGFENSAWMFPDGTGQVPGGYGLRLRAIDLAKLGQLHLEKGRWNDREVLSGDWIVESATRDQTGTGYGYYWWIDEATGSFSGKGVRGQRLVVVPRQQLVFVMTAELPPERVPEITKRLFEEFVLESVAGDKPLTEDEGARRRLSEEVEKASIYRPASRSGLPKPRLPQ